VSEAHIKSPRKLIEVALPLDAINEAAAREKSIRHGHPSTLHLWWARRPLAAARAVIFAQMVNDPSWKWEMEHSGEVPPNNLKASWAASRNRLFDILKELVKWESTTNQVILDKARAEIRKSWRETCELNKDHSRAPELFNPDKLPAFHDPFAGGGALPLEAQRLGFEAYASDLNPVAVLINKAMIEILPKFAGCSPVNPELRSGSNLIARTWEGVEALVEDIRYYGQWVREEAQKRLGRLYPPVEITADIAKDRPDLKPLVGEKLTVIAWIWARTVKSPNPAFRHVDVPLASTFVISSKEGKEVYIEPVVRGDTYDFAVKLGKPPARAKDGTKISRGANFRCLLSDAPIEPQYVKAEGRAGRMGATLMAVVVEGPRGRLYIPPPHDAERIAREIQPQSRPDVPLPNDPRNFWTVDYGLTTYADLFTPRQIAALCTFSELVSESRRRIAAHALAAGLSSDERGLNAQGNGAVAYAEAVSIYLAFALDKVADRGSSLGRWDPTPTQSGIINTFSRQSLPMTWDFAESNPLGDASGNFLSGVDLVTKAMFAAATSPQAYACQLDAATQTLSQGKVVSTDPPYYDNIGYADLSDFFYVWLRRALKPVFPELFATVTVPKTEELVATPYRHGGKEQAESFFLNGMTQAMEHLAAQAHASTPVTIYYAFKQSETKGAGGTSSTGWETFLEAVIRSGFALTGTWPMRTELSNRMIGSGTNALASSIILVCRKRLPTAETVSRRTFLREVNQILPEALDEMTRGAGDDRSPVAPVDLSQAIIGPGMAVFSKYAAVLEADGTPMSVRTALQLINRFLAEDDFDHDTQFCLHWFEQHGWADGRFGEADTLARAKGTSVDGVKNAGVLYASGGIVRLLKWSDYPTDWDAATDNRLPVWELLHHLIRVFKTDGETGAGKLLAATPGKAEATRQLAYRLHTLCERAGWAEDARAYNEIVTSWSAIEAAATAVPVEKQASLFS
jgi:putative DNA methylase